MKVRYYIVGFLFWLCAVILFIMILRLADQYQLVW